MRLQREFQKALNSKPKAGRQLGRVTLEVATPKSKALKQGNEGDSDEEDDEPEEGETHFGNILIKRCPRTPYFMDPYGAAPPVATEENTSRGITFPQAPPRKRRFLGSDISKLRQMVRQQNQQLLFSQLYNRTMENGNLTIADLQAFENEKQRISKLSDYELERDASRIDWETVQASGFTSRTVKELEAEWKLFCDPNFERGPWTAAEDEALLASVDRHKERYWDLVAADMGNRRLPVQYLARYQQVLKPRNAPDARETTSRSYSVKTVLKGKPLATRGAAYSVAGAKDVERPVRANADGSAAVIDGGDDDVIMTAKSGVKWTPEEDEMLVEAVKKFGDKNWASVATLLGGLRTGQQCLHRWQKTLNPEIRRGRWDPREDNLLAMAVRAYGAGNWRLIHKHVPGRTDVQCRERWVNVLDPAVKSTEGWTAAEDAHLMNVVASQPPGKWSIVAKLHNEGMLAEFYRKYPHLNPQGATSSEYVAAQPSDQVQSSNGTQNSESNQSSTQTSSQIEATMHEDIEVTATRPASTPGKSAAQNDKIKPPSTRTDNHCWRRYKMLAKKPDRTPATPNAASGSTAASPRSPSAIGTPRVRKSAKKTRTRKHPDWMRDDDEDSEEEDFRGVIRAKPSTAATASASTPSTPGRISSRLAAKAQAKAAEDETGDMEIDLEATPTRSSTAKSNSAKRGAAKAKEKGPSDIQIERVKSSNPDDPNAKPRLKLLIKRTVVEKPPQL